MNVFVGCSSRKLPSQVYNISCDVAKRIARWIVTNNHNYVFGANANGLMGVIYHEIHKAPMNSKIIGATLRCWGEDLKFLDCDEYRLFNELVERKNFFFQRSDIFIFLPGGLGTADELISIILSKIYIQENKEIIIFNPSGYFDNLIKSFDIRFNGKRPESLFRLAYTEQELMDFLSNL